eukprot:gene13452-15897_t
MASSIYACVLFVFTVLSCSSSFVNAAPSWEKLGRSAPTDHIRLRFHLKQQNLKLLEEKLVAISDPRNKDFSQHLTNDELSQLIAPDAKEVQRLTDLLHAKDATAVASSSHGDYLFASLPVAAAESLFTVEIFDFQVKSSTGTRICSRSEEIYKISNMPSLVEAVTGIADFRPAGARRMAKTFKPSGPVTTPKVIRDLYKLDNATVNDPSIPGQAVAEFEEAYFFESDINMAQKRYGFPQKNITRVIGPNHPLDGYLAEASLDTQYIMNTAPGINTWVFSVDTTLGFDLIAWALNVSSTPDAPKVHSISWGSPEVSSWFTDDTLIRTNVEFMKLSLLGFSVIVSSGDSGTGNTGIFKCKKFDPNFPATSPYVTAVGGTYLDASDVNTELGWASSGGGFSSKFSMPQYQAEAAQAYLQKAGAAGNLPDEQYFNSSGRAIPDVAALAVNYEVAMQGFWDDGVSGTSAAAPVFAGIVALLNDARFAQGKKALGFLNSWLYQTASIGSDILSGENK